MLLTELVLVKVLLVAVNAEYHASFPFTRRENSKLEDNQEVDESFRLPNETFPTHYTIHLRTAVHEGVTDFQGSVDIQVNVVQRTDKITVHNRGLSILAATLYHVQNDDLVKIDQPNGYHDERTEHFVFQCASLLSIGTYLLSIDYTGKLQYPTSNGFFMKFYRDETNHRRSIASTQFEPTRARMAFPCYDEPTLKATFSVSITHHRTYNAVSNMPMDDLEVVDMDYVTSRFKKTPLMSTYLVAFVVSDFETKSLGQQQIHARSNAIRETAFALQVGKKILDALNFHTGVSYYNYMPKLGQIAVPDWGAGAMENWGLVTYGEPGLLFNPERNAFHNQKYIVTTIAHEYAHQWFGNLVTTDWWQYIWLNEGFATLYGYYGAQLAIPDQAYMDLFQVEVHQLALGTDASETTRPMDWNADSPAAISALFDRVAYEKAGSVLNMFRIIIGDDKWRAAIKEYLLSSQLSAAKPDDLYAALENTISRENNIPDNMTIKTIMESWITVAGYPVLNVRRNYHTKKVIISQERFLNDKRVPNDHVWHLPYNVANQRDQNFELASFEWLTTKAAEITIDAADPGQWLIFNRQQFGFYRVNYDTRNWELITDALIVSSSSVHPNNRAQLIDDAFNLARADLLDFGVVLRLLTAVAGDQEYLPWAAADNVLVYLFGKLRGTVHYEGFESFVHFLIGQHYPSIQIESVDDDGTLIRNYFRRLISTWACRTYYADCMTKAQETFKTAVNANVGTHPDVSSVIYCYGIQHATNDEFSWLLNRMLISNNAAERMALIDAIGCAQKADHLKTFLASSISAAEEINYYESERVRMLHSVYTSGRTGVDAVIRFLNDRNVAEDVIRLLGQSAFNDAISNIASRTNTVEEFDELKQLLDKVGTLVSEEVIKSAYDKFKENLDWHESLEGLIVTEFLEQYHDKR
ncbi:aminopeptidase N-like [Toxorhynchites rutilus septentrionalis]|uniref:aminopeptidase N-like n=1 Tax=Toxorhynchites rutilus septentrionalis TaxID=329112 RepID=UPI002479CE15|nr:aminopeptidase N-like [Toxorhynchites rutilus septentrionalis]